MEPSNYDGPGIYRHYKGGHYRVLGIAKNEATGQLTVVYHSYSVEHDLDRWMQGADFVNRPLNQADCPGGEGDAFNDLVTITGEHTKSGLVTQSRFQKIHHQLTV